MLFRTHTQAVLLIAGGDISDSDFTQWFALHYTILTQVMRNIKSVSGHICCHGNNILPRYSGEFKSEERLAFGLAMQTL